MTQGIKQKLGLSSAALRYLALFFMLLDHIWIALAREQVWLTCIGRLAFPMFAFLIAEGFYHTSDKKKYAMRLFVSGIISELPYNVFKMANLVDPKHQNVMFTLLFGLLALWVVQWAKDMRSTGRYVLACAAFAALYVLADRLYMDYGGVGVTMVVMFGLVRGLKYEKLLQALCLVVMNCFIKGKIVQLGQIAFSIQNLASLSLLLIWLYNGERGAKSKTLQYGAYLFYPVHLGVLSILRRLL